MDTRKKRRLHFAYSIPHSSIGRISVLGEPLYRRYWRYLLKWPTPVSAPLSITYHVLYQLANEFDILLYDIKETGLIKLGEKDIYLGHMWPDTASKEEGSNNWTTYDPDNLTNKMILKYPGDKRVFAFGPFNHSVEQMGWAIPLLKQVHHYIAICGSYWYDRVDTSPFSLLKGKFSFLNMPLEMAHYPKVKKAFGKKGQRKFLYIGRVSKEKNTEMLEQLAAGINGFKGGYIGSGTIKGWKQIASSAALTPEYIEKIASEYDFFINTSTFDAQATTILEAMSWGFVVACTAESGYTESSIYNLSATDVEQNIEVLHTLQHTEEDTLHSVVQRSQTLVKDKYNWNIFINKLTDILKNESL